MSLVSPCSVRPTSTPRLSSRPRSNSAIKTGATSILVDLSGATFIDSTTLGVLMGAVRRLRPLGGEVAIACADPNICRIFEITLLDRVFRIFPTSDEGLDHLQVSAGSGSTTNA